MNLDFSFNEHMRLSSVKRWGIIEMSRAQSVAEHSYNVAAISLAIINAIADGIEDSGMALQPITLLTLEWALLHDLTELVTGDLPTPVKVHLREAVEEMEDKHYPRYANFRKKVHGTIAEDVVKAADFMDAIQFAKRFCIDLKREQILNEMYDKLDRHCCAFKQKYGINLSMAVFNIWHEERIPLRNISLT